MADSELERRLESIKGNAPIECKRHVLKMLTPGPPPFGRNIISRGVFLEANVDEYVTGDGKRKEICTLVFELNVEQGQQSLLFTQTRADNMQIC
jgi:hypothetical protein